MAGRVAVFALAAVVAAGTSGWAQSSKPVTKGSKMAKPAATSRSRGSAASKSGTRRARRATITNGTVQGLAIGMNIPLPGQQVFGGFIPPGGGDGLGVGPGFGGGLVPAAVAGGGVGFGSPAMGALFLPGVGFGNFNGLGFGSPFVSGVNGLGFGSPFVNGVGLGTPFIGGFGGAGFGTPVVGGSYLPGFGVMGGGLGTPVVGGAFRPGFGVIGAPTTQVNGGTFIPGFGVTGGGGGTPVVGGSFLPGHGVVNGSFGGPARLGNNRR